MKRDFTCNVLRSVQSVKDFALFNLEGTDKQCTLQSGEGYGGLAQLGERLPCKQEVSGSIPLISTKRSEDDMGQ